MIRFTKRLPMAGFIRAWNIGCRCFMAVLAPCLIMCRKQFYRFHTARQNRWRRDMIRSMNFLRPAKRPWASRALGQPLTSHCRQSGSIFLNPNGSSFARIVPCLMFHHLKARRAMPFRFLASRAGALQLRGRKRAATFMMPFVSTRNNCARSANAR